MKQTFDRWYSDQMTSSSHQHRQLHADDNDDDVDAQQETAAAPAANRMSNGQMRSGAGHGRTWFDPVTEIPRLQSWLRQNSHPSRTEMTQYARELNDGAHRQAARRPLDVNNIAYWFKNARARALSRASSRRDSSSPQRSNVMQTTHIADDARPLSKAGDNRGAFVSQTE